MNAATMLNQTPVQTAAKTDGLKTGSLRKGPSDFKKKLEDCVALEDDVPYGLSAVPVQVTGGEDGAAQQMTDIVGILEGFGLLNDESNPLGALAEGGRPVDAQMPQGGVAAQPEALTQNAEAGAFEQYARMLLNGRFGLLGEDDQQAILQAVDKYLGSLESTNNEGTAVPKAQEASLSAAQVPDKLAALMMKLKMAQSTPDAQTQAPAARPAEIFAVPQEAETVQTVQAAEGSVRENAAAVTQTAAKPEASDSAREQPVVKMEAAVQPAVQTPVQETQQAKPAEQAAQPAPAEQTDFVKDNVMRIVDKMRASAAEGRYDFDVELKPDFLGKVNIKIVMENGDIRMHIKTEDMGVKGLFTDQTSSMQAALKEKGIAVSQIDVSYQSQMQTGDGRQAFRGGSGQKRQSGRHTMALNPSVGGAVFDTMTQTPGYDWSGSSVEYLA